MNIIELAIEAGFGVIGDDEKYVITDNGITNIASMLTKFAELLQAQASEPVSNLPRKEGIYVWCNGTSAALTYVSKRATQHESSGTFNAVVINSTNFYDGCAVEKWTGGYWINVKNPSPPNTQAKLDKAREALQSILDICENGVFVWHKSTIEDICKEELKEIE